MERVSLFSQVIDVLVLMSAFRRKRRCCAGKMLSCFTIPQACEGDVAATRKRVGLIDVETIAHAPKLGPNLRQQGVRPGKIARFNCLLRLGFQGSDLGVVARLRQRRRLQRLEALGNLDERRSQPIGRDVLLAQNVECSTDLTLVEIELRLKFCNQLLLGLGIVRMLPDERFKLLGRNANGDGRAADAAADRDGAAFSPYGGLLRPRARSQPAPGRRRPT
jgi:hypothetical protein